MLRGFQLTAAVEGGNWGFCKMLRRFAETGLMSLVKDCRCWGVGGVDGGGGKGLFGLFMGRVDLGDFTEKKRVCRRLRGGGRINLPIEVTVEPIAMTE